MLKGNGVMTSLLGSDIAYGEKRCNDSPAVIRNISDGMDDNRNTKTNVTTWSDSSNM